MLGKLKTHLHMSIIHTHGVPKTGQTENTPSCAVSGSELIRVNSIDYFLHSRLCSLNTPAYVFSTHFGESRTGQAEKHTHHVSMIHAISSEMFRVKSIDYILITHSLYLLNTPGNPLHTWVCQNQDKQKTHLHVSRIHTIFFLC